MVKVQYTDSVDKRWWQLPVCKHRCLLALTHDYNTPVAGYPAKKKINKKKWLQSGVRDAQLTSWVGTSPRRWDMECQRRVGVSAWHTSSRRRESPSKQKMSPCPTSWSTSALESGETFTLSHRCFTLATHFCPLWTSSVFCLHLCSHATFSVLYNPGVCFRGAAPGEALHNSVIFPNLQAVSRCEMEPLKWNIIYHTIYIYIEFFTLSNNIMKIVTFTVKRCQHSLQ